MPSIDEQPYTLVIPTRWKDNDVYGHVNNVVYYSFFDTVINTFLIREGGLDIHAGDTIGLCVESHCRYDAPLAFPEPVTAGLAVTKLGRSSVTYAVTLFGADGAAAAEGWFVHVFVDRETRRPAGVPDGIRTALERLLVGGSQ
ncbi:acyl-CoA thioesterase [Tsukamurella paurometabola]|uniref:Acyl-ACP thioesterase n=1 Tax=Tsukamurella paurometabola TaxID=2061 RepID=A0A3P8MBW5_TSUPA|nr:thioesterase family protein [Tsukamurella paurometabola]MBS4101528.1 acyl-CoA thioesterase [Tsukamurella paurometabola]UEA84593.1 acyl-CoA thioesterase [Tsukamurella paurometabola]VDR37163.1 Acyl-ACP thioesterase [Tsukamurella paurometabola]